MRPQSTRIRAVRPPEPSQVPPMSSTPQDIPDPPADFSVPNPSGGNHDWKIRPEVYADTFKALHEALAEMEEILRDNQSESRAGCTTGLDGDVDSGGGSPPPSVPISSTPALNLSSNDLLIAKPIYSDSESTSESPQSSNELQTPSGSSSNSSCTDPGNQNPQSKQSA